MNSVYLAFVASIFLFAACTEVTKTEQRSIILGAADDSIKTRADLPACTAEIEQKTKYLTDEKKNVQCSKGEWVDFLKETEKETFTRIYKQSVESIALVKAVYRNEFGCITLFSGTAFIVADGLLMTNQHVASPSYTLDKDDMSDFPYKEHFDCATGVSLGTLISQNKYYSCGAQVVLDHLDVWYPESSKDDTFYYRRAPDAKVTTVDRQFGTIHDMVLIPTDTKGKRALEISSEPSLEKLVEIGDAIAMVGYSNATSFPQMTYGAVNYRTVLTKGSDFKLDRLIPYWNIKYGSQQIGFDAIGFGGSSGAPVFNKEGLVVGIHWGGIEFEYASASTQIVELLKKPRSIKDFAADLTPTPLIFENLECN